MLLKENIINIEKSLGSRFANLRTMVESGSIVNFHYVRNNRDSFIPHGVDIVTWNGYIDACEKYQNERRRFQLEIYAKLSDEEALELQNAELDRLNNEQMTIEAFANETSIKQHLALIQDSSSVSTEDLVKINSTPSSDRIAVRQRDDIINAILDSFKREYNAMKGKTPPSQIPFNGVSSRSHAQLVSLLNSEIESIQNMTPNQFKKYKIDLMQPTVYEKQILESRYPNLLEEGKTRSSL